MENPNLPRHKLNLPPGGRNFQIKSPPLLPLVLWDKNQLLSKNTPSIIVSIEGVYPVSCVWKKSVCRKYLCVEKIKFCTCTCATKKYEQTNITKLFFHQIKNKYNFFSPIFFHQTNKKNFY